MRLTQWRSCLAAGKLTALFIKLPQHFSYYLADALQRLQVVLCLVVLVLRLFDLLSQSLGLRQGLFLLQGFFAKVMQSLVSRLIVAHAKTKMAAGLLTLLPAAKRYCHTVAGALATAEV